MNVHIGADGTATVSLNTDNNRPIMPAQPIVEAPKQQKRSAPVAEPKPELKPATIVTQEQEQSVQVTATKAFDEAAAPVVTPPPPPPPPVQPAPTAPVAQPAVTPPPPPPPPVAQVAQVAQTQPAVTPPPPPPPPVRTPTPEELQQAYEAQKAWTPRPPEPEPTLAEVNGYMPQPMATQPPPSHAVDEASVTRDSNIRATAAALFGGHH